jgi:hypothetical protein
VYRQGVEAGGTETSLEVLVKRFILAVTCCTLAFYVSTTAAAPITFIHMGSGSGSLNGVPFDVSNFTITATGDTSDRITWTVGLYEIPHDTATITIDGLGTLTFLEPTKTFASNEASGVGFGRGSDLFDGPMNPALATWDMLTSIGPVSGNNGALMQWGTGVATSGGALVFNDDFTWDPSGWDIPSTFQAIVGTATVPAPGVVLLGALGAGLVGCLRRRGTL